MKKQSNNRSNNFPFSNETKRMKHEFIEMIQSMPDDEFACFITLFLDYAEYLDFFDNNLEEYFDDDMEEYFYDDEGEIFENEDLPF